MVVMQPLRELLLPQIYTEPPLLAPGLATLPQCCDTSGIGTMTTIFCMSIG